MNILPKKRWHVRNCDNKERVRRDEENARLEEKKEQERIVLAEKEVRISLLRKKSNICDNLEHEVESKGHITLFSGEEAASCSGKKDNVDYIKEKNAERESYEKKIGLLTYVGQSSLEAKEEGKLWYMEKKSKCREIKDSSDSAEEVDQVKKSRLDPLISVEKHMKRKKSKKDKKKKKQKHDKKLLPSSSSSSKSIEQLRVERLKRENAERQRTQQILNSNKDAHVPDNIKSGNEHRQYNSQYNPELARRK